MSSSWAHSVASLRCWLNDPYRELTAASPVRAALIFLAIGIALVMLSFPLGLSPYETAAGTSDTSAKGVGYNSAISWSLGLGCLFPLALFSLVSLFRSTPRVLAEMARAQMFITPDWKPAQPQVVQRMWSEALSRNAGIIRLFAGLAVLYSYGEWAAQSAVPLALDEPPEEQDWSVRHIGSPPLLRIANALFSLAAFSLQAVALAACVFFLGYVLTLAEFRNETSNDAAVRMVPNVATTNRRLGFEKLETVIVHVLNVGLFVFLLLHLSILWNAFLRATLLRLPHRARTDPHWSTHEPKRRHA